MNLRWRVWLANLKFDIKWWAEETEKGRKKLGLCVLAYGIVVTWLVNEVLELLRSASSYWIKRCRLSCRLKCTFARKVPATIMYSRVTKFYEL